MNAAGIRQTQIGSSCAFSGLEAPLERLRPWRDERVVALALMRWMRRPPPEVVIGRCRPPRKISRPALSATRLREVARQLRLIGDAMPSIGPEEVAGAAFFMVRNLVHGRDVTDYGDVWFQVIRGAPSARSRREYARRHRSEVEGLEARGRREEAATLRLRGAGSMYVEESLQPKLDRAALVDRGYSKAAAYQWVRRHPGMHAKDAPPPRKRQSA